MLWNPTVGLLDRLQDLTAHVTYNNLLSLWNYRFLNVNEVTEGGLNDKKNQMKKDNVPWIDKYKESLCAGAAVSAMIPETLPVYWSFF